MYYIYIVMNPSRSTLYVGVTNNLPARITEHYISRGSRKHFASKYHCHQLVYYERFEYITNAIAREKELKGWRRTKKMTLITSINPTLTTLRLP